MSNIDLICRCAGHLADKARSGHVFARAQGGSSRAEVYASPVDAGTWALVDAPKLAELSALTGHSVDMITAAFAHMAMPRIKFAKPTLAQQLKGLIGK